MSTDTQERRIHIGPNGELDRPLRIRCGELDVTVQEYVVGLLARDRRHGAAGRQAAPWRLEEGKGRKGAS